MNFLLKNIEVAIEEKYLLVGEKLLDEGKVEELFESERNLWLTQVDGFEIEVQISPSKVKAATCECGIFLKEKMCGHIAAGLFALRSRFSQKKNAGKKVAKSKPKTYRKLTTTSILENIKAEELKSFVANYAKKNRNFALALGTRFASSVPLLDNEAKYQHILSQLIQGIRRKDNKISANGFKQFLSTANELFNQAKDAFVLEHFSEAWAILKSIVPVLPLIIRSTEREIEELTLLTNDIFSQIDQLNAHSIPPELKTEIWEFITNEAPKKSYRTDDLAIQFINRFTLLADDDEKKQELFQVVFENWKYRNLLSTPHKSALLECLIELLSNPIFEKEIDGFEKSISAEFQDFRLAISAAIKIRQFKLAKQFLIKGKAIFYSTIYKDEIEKMEFQMAVKAENINDIFMHGENIFLRTGNIEVLKEIQEKLNGDWAKKRNQLIKKIKKDISLNKTELLPIIYSEEKMTDELQDYLLNTNSLELTMKYDHVFIPEKMKELTILYCSLLDNYLSQHYGEKPSKYLLKILNHLRSIGAEEVVEKTVAFIRKKYPRRMELAIELMSIN